MSPATDSTLADPQQVIADLQRRLADAEQRLEERTAGLDAALAREAAAAEILQAIHSSDGELAPVFEAILEKAMHLCGAAFGELRARDGDSFRSAGTRGVPAAFAEYRRDNAFVAEPGSLGARILAGEQVVHVLDLRDEDVYRAGYRNRRALVDLGGARTALVASLRKDDTVLGFIIVYRQEVRPFTDKQIALLQNFAHQAVIAWRTHGSSPRRARHWNNRQRRPRSCRSLIRHQATSGRCSTRSSKGQCGCARPASVNWMYTTASITALPQRWGSLPHWTSTAEVS